MAGIASRVLSRVYQPRPRSGSGLPARRVIQVLVWARRASQGGVRARFL
jgi:hypothetical protein